MANISEKQATVAQVYSDALLDLAERAGQADEVLSELQELVGLAQRDASFGHFVASPLLDAEARSGSLEKLFRGQASDLVTNTLLVMNRKGRLHLLPALAKLYRQSLMEKKGRVDVEVTTAVPLDDSLRQSLAASLTKLTGKRADFSEKVDPQLLGGLVVRVGDRKIDSSVTRKLRILGEKLEERAGRELLERSYFTEAAG